MDTFRSIIFHNIVRGGVEKEFALRKNTQKDSTSFGNENNRLVHRWNTP